MKQAHIYISGFVQGVGFRQFVKKEARKLSLTGWVKNLPDNRVEAVFQGPEVALNKIIEICRKGSFLSEVEDVQILWGDMEKEISEFEIIN